MALTEEDKNWIATLVRGSADATAALIRESERRTADATAALIRESERRTAGAIEATETKLLTAFHQWASPMEARMRTHTAAIRALDLEFEALSDRVDKLEPPH
jgi:hypothetical protein